jgi:hypothetical protein
MAIFVQNEAAKYGVNCIVYRESQWQADRTGDIGNPNGESVGLWQIGIQQHPDITVAEALPMQGDAQDDGESQEEGVGGEAGI